MIPILWNHDHTKVVGKLTIERDRLVVEMASGHAAPRSWFEYAFGNAGYIVTDFEGDRIKRAEILEFSVTAALIRQADRS